MEYLSRSLATLHENPAFGYHPRCKRVRLTHVLFADDILLFSRGDLKSITTLMQVFHNFSQASGLQVNVDKCEVFFAGVNVAAQKSISEALGMKIRSLPFKYLGVPLAFRKLKYNECKMLLDKITKPVSHWSFKLLSYGARLALINSVLSSMKAFWGHLFLLPKKLIKEVEGVCRDFLWTGLAQSKKKPLVAWETVCSPFKQGCLNVKNFVVWNRCAVLKQLCNCGQSISTRKDYGYGGFILIIQRGLLCSQLEFQLQRHG